MFSQPCANQSCGKMIEIRRVDWSQFLPQDKDTQKTCACGQKNKISLAKLRTAFLPKPIESDITPPISATQEYSLPKTGNIIVGMNASQTAQQAARSAEELGWLTVHDEKTRKQTLALKKGINVIGRYDEEIQADLQIHTTDEHMSRRHCVIEVESDISGQVQYILYDVGKLETKPSMNGIFVNEQFQLQTYKLPNDRIVFTEVYVKDGDTIQIGYTKLVLKTADIVKTAHDAERVVNNMNFRKTIYMHLNHSKNAPL
jgi:pSer/pThr/pTyr-binding forkhead associated (FHA) protein